VGWFAKGLALVVLVIGAYELVFLASPLFRAYLSAPAGQLDFAGGTVVHLSPLGLLFGLCSIALAIMVLLARKRVA
jgi:hypothetical protein